MAKQCRNAWHDAAVSVLHRLRMLRTHDVEVTLQWLEGRLGQDRHAILAALAVAHDDQTQVEVDVLHAQLQRLLQAKPTAVEDGADQPVVVLKPGEDRANLRVREHDRQPAPQADPCGLNPNRQLTA